MSTCSFTASTMAPAPWSSRCATTIASVWSTSCTLTLTVPVAIKHSVWKVCQSLLCNSPKCSYWKTSISWWKGCATSAREFPEIFQNINSSGCTFRTDLFCEWIYKFSKSQDPPAIRFIEKQMFKIFLFLLQINVFQQFVRSLFEFLQVMETNTPSASVCRRLNFHGVVPENNSLSVQFVS